MSVSNVQANVMTILQQHSQPTHQQHPPMLGQMGGPRKQSMRPMGQMPGGIAQGNVSQSMNPKHVITNIQTTPLFSINVGNVKNGRNVATSGFTRNLGIPPLNSQKQQQPQQQMVNIGVQVMGQNAQNIGNQSQNQTLQKFMMTFNRKSTNPYQYQQIINTLKSSPQLMSTFIKQRQVGVL